MTDESGETAESDLADGDAAAGDTGGDDLPTDAADEAERLTRLAREALDDGEREAYLADRERLLAQYDFTARIREEDDTLVLHPEEWTEDGTIYPSRIDDLDRAHEISLSGPGDPEEWDEIEAHNAALVEAVREAHGEVHAANARAFADFMGNHYARRVETADAPEIREFLAEYYPRNAWPSDEQKSVVEASIELVFDAADAEAPAFRRARR
ncbi:MAG: rnhA operon protein [Haloferacaceae archaeon]